ncbi:hypothetical protein ACQ86D_23295 [Streptomyces galilaeus]
MKITVIVIILYVLGFSPEWIGCSVALAGFYSEIGADRRSFSFQLAGTRTTGQVESCPGGNADN